MTTNLAEVYNFVLRGNRALPLTTIVEVAFHGTLRYFSDRHDLVNIWNEVWPFDWEKFGFTNLPTYNEDLLGSIIYS